MPNPKDFLPPPPWEGPPIPKFITSYPFSPEEMSKGMDLVARLGHLLKERGDVYSKIARSSPIIPDILIDEVDGIARRYNETIRELLNYAATLPLDSKELSEINREVKYLPGWLDGYGGRPVK